MGGEGGGVWEDSGVRANMGAVPFPAYTLAMLTPPTILPPNSETSLPIQAAFDMLGILLCMLIFVFWNKVFVK